MAKLWHSFEWVSSKEDEQYRVEIRIGKSSDKRWLFFVDAFPMAPGLFAHNLGKPFSDVVGPYDTESEAKRAAKRYYRSFLTSGRVIAKLRKGEYVVKGRK